MERSSWDAVIFIPKRNIRFHGFGVYANWGAKDMKYQIKWYIGDEEYGEREFEIADSEKDPEKKWFEIYLNDLGEKPINVSEGQEINLCIRVTTTDYEIRRCFYGYRGYERDYSVLPD